MPLLVRVPAMEVLSEIVINHWNLAVHTPPLTIGWTFFSTKFWPLGPKIWDVFRLPI